VTKGWSAALIFAFLLLLIVRYFLHIGGFWDIAALRRLEERDPMLATLLSVISLKRLPGAAPEDGNPWLAGSAWVVRGILLAGSLLLTVLAILLIVTAFFGGPL
jgi:hypothetical protein